MDLRRVWENRVRFEETDLQGVVFYGNYVTYQDETVYGISDNDRKYYSIERAREVLGYEPRDNAARWEGAEYVGHEG